MTTAPAIIPLRFETFHRIVAPRFSMGSPGQVIGGRYRLIETLGHGGMAAVWRAEHIAMGRMVALKIIAPELVKHNLALARFRQEAKAAASLGSQHVVRLFDYDIDHAAGPYIVMELLEGESLGARIGRLGILPPSDVARIIEQVSKGLSRAHASSIIHRDLKPENIFLTKDEEDEEEIAKILDFGIAKVPLAASDGLTAAGLILGTVSHMSPEQAIGQEVDHRSDLYSLGIIAYQCLTGEVPFEQESLAAWLVSICTTPLPVPSHQRSDLPRAFDTWFAKACHKDPDQRFQHAQDLSAALGKALTLAPRLLLVDSVAPQELVDCYVMNEGVTIGPIDMALLKRGIQAGKIPSTSFVWCQGWAEWKSIQAIHSELESIVLDEESIPLSGHGLLALGRPSVLPPHAPTTLPIGRIDVDSSSKREAARAPRRDSKSDYFVTDGDNLIGPVSGALVRKGIDMGKVDQDWMVWRDGWQEWKTVGVLLAIDESGPSEEVQFRDGKGLSALGAPSSPFAWMPPPPKSTVFRGSIEYYVTDGEETVGPVTATLLKAGIEENRVPETAWVWTQGWKEWRRIIDLGPDLLHVASAPVETLRPTRGIHALAAPSSPPAQAPDPRVFVLDRNKG